MKYGYIYIIKNKVNQKYYVGQTNKTIKIRWKQHKDSYKIRNQVIYLAMRKYGIENFYIEEIEKIPEKQLDNREQYWIKKLDTMTPNGYNMTYGGDFNPMHIPEIAQKVSKHFIGDKNPAKRPEVREKIRQSALGKKASEETKKKMSVNNGKYWKGKKHSLETRKKISENHSCRGKFGGLNPNSKCVARIDEKTNIILEKYNSLKEAEHWINNNIKSNATYTNITKCCNGKQKTAYGFKWTYI